MSRMNASGYVSHVTIVSSMLTTARRFRVRISFSVRLVSGYAHVFVPLSVVILTLPLRIHFGLFFASRWLLLVENIWQPLVRTVTVDASILCDDDEALARDTSPAAASRRQLQSQ